MEFREFSAKTVSDCITDACTTFSVPSDRLEYEVISEGSAGFMGIGAKQAKINARVKEESFEEVEEARKKVKEKEDEEKAALKKEKEERKEKEKAAKKAAKEEEKKAKKAEEVASKASMEAAEEVVPVEKETKKPRRELTEEEINEVNEKAVKFLKDVFASMGITVEINCKYNLLDDCFDIDLAGDKMGILIGKRGQTLDSLQYLTSLVVNKGTSEYIRVKIDTENYRQRRKETLENLAKNIAFKVKRTRRPVSLEPMNPYERRIIHSTLQSDKYVTTHSEGEEPFRKVVVTLKR